MHNTDKPINTNVLAFCHSPVSTTLFELLASLLMDRKQNTQKKNTKAPAFDIRQTKRWNEITNDALTTLRALLAYLIGQPSQKERTHGDNSTVQYTLCIKQK